MAVARDSERRCQGYARPAAAGAIMETTQLPPAAPGELI